MGGALNITGALAIATNHEDLPGLAVQRAGVLVGRATSMTSRKAAYVAEVACISAGHIEVAELLLEAGAVCNEHTFDGDRIHYAGETPQPSP